MRKYFRLRVSHAFESSPRAIWENRDEQIKGYYPDRTAPFGGLKLTEPPKLTFDRKGRRGPRRDSYTFFQGMWFVSDRLKKLLEQLDPDAFAFFPVEVDYGQFKQPGPAYWVCNFIRILDCVDEERSDIRYQEDISWKNYINVIKLEVKPEIVGSAHAFRLQYGYGHQIVDHVIADAFGAEQITGFRLERL